MRLKVININIWIGGILWEELLEFLKRENPDILLTQEIYNGDTRFQKKQFKSFSELQKELGFEYAAFAPTFEEDSDELSNDGKLLRVIQGNAVFSKFPLEEVATIFYDVPFGGRDPYDATQYHITPRNLQHVTTLIGTKKLHILNTQGIWGEHGGDTPRRLEMAEKILSEVGENAPLVLAGDFNVHEKTQTVDALREKLVSVFYGEMQSSFNIRRKDLVKSPGYASSVVDMFFVTKDIAVVAKEVSEVDVSDHKPLICEIEI